MATKKRRSDRKRQKRISIRKVMRGKRTRISFLTKRSIQRYLKAGHTVRDAAKKFRRAPSSIVRISHQKLR